MLKGCGRMEDEMNEKELKNQMMKDKVGLSLFMIKSA